MPIKTRDGVIWTVSDAMKKFRDKHYSDPVERQRMEEGLKSPEVANLLAYADTLTDEERLRWFKEQVMEQYQFYLTALEEVAAYGDEIDAEGERFAERLLEILSKQRKMLIAQIDVCEMLGTFAGDGPGRDDLLKAVKIARDRLVGH